MGACPTCTVQYKDGGKDVVTINLADFDEAIHKKVMVKKEVSLEATEGGDGEDSPKVAKKGAK